MRKYIQAVLFDLDGVIVSTDQCHFQAWKRLCDEKGWNFDETVNHRLRGVSRADSLREILAHNSVSLPTEEFQQCLTDKNQYYRRLIGELDESCLIPGVVEFLQQLKERNVKLGICSASHNARDILQQLHLNHFFDAAVLGGDFICPRPDPEIFLTAASKLQVPPFHCVVFEDAQTGVEAALRAGMKCVGVGAAERLCQVPQTISDYFEVNLDTFVESGFVHPIPPDPWFITETAMKPNRCSYWESIFALSNGFLGLRGTYEENYSVAKDKSCPGMFINGVYEYEDYNHPIALPGYPSRKQVIVNLCDWRVINLWVDGERFSMFSGKVSDYCRHLDMRNGTVVRSLKWSSPNNKTVKIRITRLVSMSNPDCAAIRYEITPVTPVKELRFKSLVRHKPQSAILKNPSLKLVDTQVLGDVDTYEYNTLKSGFTIVAGFKHSVTICNGKITTQHVNSETESYWEFTIANLSRDTSVVLDKIAAFAVTDHSHSLKLSEVVKHSLSVADGFDTLYSRQISFWTNYWKCNAMEIVGCERDQQAVRFCQFHLRQSLPNNNGYTSISPSGLTGDNYWGLVFWDTEMYINPYFLRTDPDKVRGLLLYRYNLLDQARKRAKELGGKGALYAWCSINGEECGIIYEAATAEYHLLCDIVYAIDQYVISTDDWSFLYDYGAEIIFETARFLASLGKFIPYLNNRFCFNTVCGPDEYGCGVNNNCYTNSMAQWHFRYACTVYEKMQQACPQRLSELCSMISLCREELELWRCAADQMYIPYDRKLGIHAQDDSFLSLDPAEMDTIPWHVDLRSQLHALSLWRTQVIKQADVVLLMFTLSDSFSRQQKEANYEFYEPKTNHGSSLSTAIHSIIASEIGRTNDAYFYFQQSALLDLFDLKRNTSRGVHLGSLGGAWMAIVYGFAGMRLEDGCLKFSPTLPEAWKSYSFKVFHRSSSIKVTVQTGQVCCEWLEGPEISILLRGRTVRLSSSCRKFEYNW